MAKPDIKYLNKDFTAFKQSLIEYAKSYYPTNYNDFTTASPGTMFIDMASYVGDVLSFYLDNQLQETFLEFAKQQSNLYSLAYMLGYKPRATSAAVVNIDIYQQIPAKTIGGVRQPDFNYALIIQEGMQISSNINPSMFFDTVAAVDFSLSSSVSPTEINVYEVNPATNQPESYILKKTVQAISGERKTTTYSFGNAIRFPSVTLKDTNIVQIAKVTDLVTGDLWYEVPYLAQDYILQPVQNTAAAYPSLHQSSYQVPYILEKVPIQKRFVTRLTAPDTLLLEFGAGINQVTSSAIIPNPFNVGIGTVDKLSMLNTAFDPTLFVTTENYGIAPSNTTLQVEYLVGGGAASNVSSEELTIIRSAIIQDRVPNLPLSTFYRATLAVNNPQPAVGGGNGDTNENIRLNALAQFPTQMRAVTQQDYLAIAMSMPPKYGRVAKAYITKDDILFNRYQVNEPGERDPLAASLYILTYNLNNQFDYPAPAMLRNMQTYLNDYRMLNDSIKVKPAYIINIQVSFDIVTRPNYPTREVLASCLELMRDYFNTDKWQINQPILLNQIYSLLDQVAGVQTVQSVRVTNVAGSDKGYSEYAYDLPGATLDDVIYPSLDPSIFEVRYPDIDIQGRVVTM
jgi:hypothetical protein